ncbi:MAG: hypothetical protein RLY31_3122 [Bacteroidota bacterium]|jgi:hypothetical protein
MISGKIPQPGCGSNLETQTEENLQTLNKFLPSHVGKPSKNWKCLLMVSFLPVCLYAQPAKAENDTYETKYAWRIRQEMLFGSYIPKDLQEVFLELNRKTDERSRQLFRSMPEDAAVEKLFFSLGRWMTHNWSLYEGSRLSRYFQELGVYHPDEMVSLIIVAYHRSLNRKPLEIKALIEEHQERSRLRNPLASPGARPEGG